MKFAKVLSPAILASLLLAGCAALPPAEQEETEAQVAQREASNAAAIRSAVAGPSRTPGNSARDRYRHPQETLEFFGIGPEKTVLEIWPGGGWYTEILAPLLREKGRYIAAKFALNPEKPSAYYQGSNEKFVAKLAANPEWYDRAVVTEIGKPASFAPVAPASVDTVLTFRNVHNWIAGDFSQQMFNAFYAALKPGGVLGVVEHRAKPGTTIEQMKTSGYVTEDFVITQAIAAGFQLDARREINANPLDTKDYAEGVWTLPPSLELGEKDKEKYLAIGESDRMTLRFIKPKPKSDN